MLGEANKMHKPGPPLACISGSESLLRRNRSVKRMTVSFEIAPVQVHGSATNFLIIGCIGTLNL